MGKVWKFRKKLGKNWKFGDQFETQKKIGNLEKKLEIWKKIGNSEIGYWKLDNIGNLSKLLPWYITKVCQLSIKNIDLNSMFIKVLV